MKNTDEKNYLIVYFILMVSITYKMAKDSRFINNIKTGKRNRLCR